MFGPVIIPPIHLGAFSILENKLIGYADDSTLMAIVPSQGVRVTEAESMSRGLVKVSEWCDLRGMKLNASKTKTIIVYRSHTMHPQSPSLTIGGTVLKESNNLVILAATFDSKMTFEKHLRSISRADSQRLGILRKSRQVFHDSVAFHHKELYNITIQHDIIQYITHVITHSTHFTVIMFLVAPIEPSTLL